MAVPVGEHHQVGAAAPPEAYPIARSQLAFGDGIVVDERAVPRLAIPQDHVVAVEQDLGMLARDFTARQA